MKYIFRLSGPIGLSQWTAEADCANDEQAYDTACAMLHNFRHVEGVEIEVFNERLIYIGSARWLLQHEVRRPLNVIKGAKP